MKKFLLFFAALCCTLGVLAETITYYDVLPSGTGVNERTIVNMEYDMNTQTLSFDDTYLPTFTAHRRWYYVYFHEWKPEYKYVEKVLTDWKKSYVYYQGSLIKNPDEDSNWPAHHDFAMRTVANSNGGHVTIDLNEAIIKLKSITSSSDILVSIMASYQVAENSNSVEYSIYPENAITGMSAEGAFLLNSQHIKIESSASAEAQITLAKTDKGIVKPENSKKVEIRANGDDEADILSVITLKNPITQDVEYVWEYCDDNSTEWQEMSKGVVSKADFEKGNVPFCKIIFTEKDKPVDVRRVRLKLVIDEFDTVYSDKVEIFVQDEKYDLYIGGKQITSRNCNDFYGYGRKEVVYYPASNTLILKNDSPTNFEGDFIVSYSSGQTLNICVIGDCEIRNQSTSGSVIRSDYRDVRIYGEGKLKMVGGDGILCESNLLLTDGVTVDIDCYYQSACGISLYGEGVLTVDNATLNVKGNPSVWNVQDIVMKNGVNILSEGHKFDATKKAVVDASGNATSETVTIGVGTPDVNLAGDVNLDGNVNIQDVTALVNIILGKSEKNAQSDVNKDSEVNIQDVTALVNIILGK